MEGLEGRSQFRAVPLESEFMAMNRLTRIMAVSIFAGILGSGVALSIMTMLGYFQNNWSQASLMALNVAMFTVPALAAQVFGRYMVVFSGFTILYAVYSIGTSRRVELHELPFASLAFLLVGIVVTFLVVKLLGTTIPRRGQEKA